ncbi:hypothetical protein Tco_0689875 [Tanacetum coccineum]
MKEGSSVGSLSLVGSWTNGGGWMSSVLGSSVSFVASLSFSTTGGGIGGPSYENTHYGCYLHWLHSWVWNVILLGKELELEGEPYLVEKETAKGKSDDDEVHNLRSVETEFPTIVFDNMLTSQAALSCEPTVSPLNDNEIDFRISLDESYDEDYKYTDADIMDFEERLGRIYSRGIHRMLVLDFKSLLAVMSERLTSRMLMEHSDDQGQNVFTSRAWRRFSEAIVDIDAEGMLQFQLGGARRRMSWRQFILALGLHTAEEMETAGFGLYWAESATLSFT